MIPHYHRPCPAQRRRDRVRLCSRGEEDQPPCICPVIRPPQAIAGRWKDATYRGTSRWSGCSRCGPRTFEASWRILVPKGRPKIHSCRPIEPAHEVWASGVTYLQSREARELESTDADAYEKVYDAERPELFFKALGWRVVGHGDSGTRPRGQPLERARARARPGRQQRDGDRRLHRGQRRVLAGHRGREPTVSSAGQGLRRLLLSGARHRSLWP